MGKEKQLITFVDHRVEYQGYIIGQDDKGTAIKIISPMDTMFDYPPGVFEAILLADEKPTDTTTIYYTHLVRVISIILERYCPEPAAPR